MILNISLTVLGLLILLYKYLLEVVSEVSRQVGLARCLGTGIDKKVKLVVILIYIRNTIETLFAIIVLFLIWKFI